MNDYNSIIGKRTITVKEWQEEARRRFGPDILKWKFVCPSCGHVASIKDWRDAGAEEGEIAFSCVGRHSKQINDAFTGKRPCNYAGGGLFRFNPVTVVYPNGQVTVIFEFAE